MRLGVRSALVGGELLAGDVDVCDGTVAAVGLSPRPGARGLAAPGFVDLHVNGFAGVDFMRADRSAYARAGEAILATGTTACRPTFVSAPEEEIVAALAELPPTSFGPRVLGAHLEGPFLSPHRLGVHSADARRDPDLELLERLLAAGPVAQMTLAPELPGADALVDRLVAAGVTVSAGHSDATAQVAHAAFDRGIRTVTHLFNAMRPMSARDPGLALAALARDDVRVQLIVDGHHVADDAVHVAWRAARGRLSLVTDAVAAAGLGGDGESELAGRRLTVTGSVVRDQAGRLAGSTLTMDAAVRRLLGLGVPLVEALHAASAVPAQIAGRADLGRLEPGASADVVVLGDDLEVLRVLVGGAAVA